MPELPEVATFQKVFERHALHRPIREVIVHDGHILRNNLTADDFAARLTGRTFVETYRRGKYLFGRLDNGEYVQLHFGMTGDLAAYTDPADAPRFERFRLHFADGSVLGFDDARKFAHIVWVGNDLPGYLQKIKLADDALEISEALFVERLAKRRGQLKAFLLDQRAVAGVGNLYADEICFQARIHPGSRLENLNDEQRRQIFGLMRSILGAAVERLAQYRHYPEDWFWQWRTEGAAGPEGVGVVRRTTIAGRTTYFVDGWQELYGAPEALAGGRGGK